MGRDKSNVPRNLPSSAGFLEASGSDGRCHRHERDAGAVLGDDVDGCAVRLPVAIEDLISLAGEEVMLASTARLLILSMIDLLVPRLPRWLPCGTEAARLDGMCKEIS